MQECKATHCNSCPAYAANGRCIGAGASRADIAFLLGPPKEEVTKHDYTAHTDSLGRLLGEIHARIVFRHPALQAAKVFKTHAAQCVLEKDDAEVIKHCRDLVHTQLAMAGCKVIFAMGAAAMKSVGIQGSVDSVRGKVFDLKINGQAIKCIPTYNPGTFYRKESAGLVNTFEQDLFKALSLSLGISSKRTLEEMTANYKIGKTNSESIAILEEILAARTQSGGYPLLAVDTETTGLQTWLPDFKCIALSFCWGEGKSAAILYDHREKKDDWRELEGLVKKVLSGPNPKTFHNFQYDYKVLECAKKYPVENVKWDSMFGEYLLDECKQGLYGLDDLVRNRVPEFTDYKEYFKNKAKIVSPDTAGLIDHAKNEIDLKNEHKKWALAQAKDPSFDKEKVKEFKDLAKQRADEIKELKTKVAELKEKLERETEVEKAQTFEDRNVDDLLLYAAIDTDCTWRITMQQQKEVAAEGTALFKPMCDVMLPAARALGLMEHEGVKVDMAYLDQLDKEFGDIMVENEAFIDDFLEKNGLKSAGEKLNLDAPADIVKLLTVKLGLQLTKTTKKSGAFSTSKDVLEELESQHPLVKKLQDWKKAAKMRSTFIPNIRDAAKSDGRVHTSYKLTGTVTGRTSSASPNLQNVPARGVLGRNVKKIFIPDNDDEVFVNMDYSGAEIRVMTAYAPDKDLIDSLNKGLNIHSFVASQIFTEVRIKNDDGSVRLHKIGETQEDRYSEIQGRKKYAKTDPKLYEALDNCRQFAKTTVFLTIYGGGAAKLHENLSKEDDSITLQDCENIINTFLGRFPVIRVYMETIKREVATKGYVWSKFGRKRRFPLASVDWKLKLDAFKEGVNFPIQGTSSDLVLSAICAITNRRDDIGLKPRLTVHDSIGFSVKKENAPLVRDFLDKYAEQHIATSFPWMPVPFIYEAGWGPTYGECKNEIK